VTDERGRARFRHFEAVDDALAAILGRHEDARKPPEGRLRLSITPRQIIRGRSV
jgi:hypothetical protein